MPIWNVTPIEEQPSVELYRWTIKEMLDNKGIKQSYIVGEEYDGCGRVSTAIVDFDEERCVARTSSGRIYQLVGLSHPSRTGNYVWETYKKINNLSEIIQ